MTQIRYLRWAVAVAVLALVAVVVFRYLVLEDRSPESPCPDWRWIGIKTDTTPDCPAPAGQGWSVGPLFQGGAPPGELSHFCLYTRDRVVGDEEGALKALSDVGLASVALDCAVVPPAGALADDSSQTLNQQLRSQVDWTPVPRPRRTDVRLALLDTAPVNLPGKDHGRSKHGFTLFALARDLLCATEEDEVAEEDGSGCLADVTARPALPIVKFHPYDPKQHQRDTATGGYVGTFSDLATAVYQEVTAWNPTSERLILNLAVAWDPRFGGLESHLEEMGAGALAVYRTIEHAVCRGALVVAAAGNVLGRPSSDSGPLLPGAWETLPAPAAPTCQSAGPSPVYRPLLYAAGGVRTDGRELANARPKGLPRLVAYGDHAVTEHRDPAASPGTPTATLTGSSVSTLVASATAAAVWYTHPNLTAQEVMEQVYRTGRPAGQRADFYLKGQPQPDRHRVSFCGAVGATCPISIGGGRPYLSAALQGFSNQAAVLGIAAGKAASDPFQSLPGLMARSWIGPQPEADPCPGCTFTETATGSGTILGEIDPAFNGRILSELTLTIGGASQSLQIPPSLLTSSKLTSSKVQGLTGGSQFKIENLKVGPQDAITLTFRVDDSAGSAAALSSVLAAR